MAAKKGKNGSGNGVPNFAPVGEAEVTRAIIDSFAKQVRAHVKTDVIVIGGGPSGLVCAKDVAKAGRKVMLVESNNYLGGGFWVGGFLMNTVTVRDPGQEFFDELGIPYEELEPGLYGAQGPHAAGKLIGAAGDAGVLFQNLTRFEDIVLRPGRNGKPRVAGAVLNWSPVARLPHEITCVDPVAFESKLVVDATGHDAWVMQKLRANGLVEVPGHASMWVEKSERLVVEHTGSPYPGVVVTGMSVTSTYNLPRMGPTFSSMLYSGERAARVCIDLLDTFDEWALPEKTAPVASR